MQEFLKFWQSHGDEKPEMTMLEFLQRSAEAEDDWEIEYDEFLSEMMGKLEDKSKFEPIADLTQLQGTLREYHKRGVSWLSYLEQLGLNGCLADDMGLGKSIQVIARLIQEREINHNGKKQKPPSLLPTLLIAPTSVVGNWQREIAKFAPHLKSIVHHGSSRIQDIDEFKTSRKPFVRLEILMK
jgi:SNF2 family DNA or RNA helicase